MGSDGFPNIYQQLKIDQSSCLGCSYIASAFWQQHLVWLKQQATVANTQSLANGTAWNKYR